MNPLTASAIAHPNIALIKYWGDVNPELHIPANSSLSMNLDGLATRTEVRFDGSLAEEHLTLNGKEMDGEALARVSKFMGAVREMAHIDLFCEVISNNNFPTGAGIASSAAGFAALSLAATRAAGIELDEKSLSRLARRGSGSACRSVPGGYVEWQAGKTDEDSFAFSMAPAEHWKLIDCIAVVEGGPKKTGSSEGHLRAASSPLQAARITDCARRLARCRETILERDFNALAAIIEEDSNLMHAVMMTSKPALFYWEPASLRLIKTIPQWRKQGLKVGYTLDAGPNVHLICPSEAANELIKLLEKQEGVQEILQTGVGGAATLDE